MTKQVFTIDDSMRVQGKSSPFRGEITTDVSKKWGGMEEYGSPTELFAASLACCILSVMAIKAKSLSISISGMTASVEKEMDPQGGFARITVVVECSQPLATDVIEKLEKVAFHCPVHRAISSIVKQEIHFNWNRL